MSSLYAVVVNYLNNYQNVCTTETVNTQMARKLQLKFLFVYLSSRHREPKMMISNRAVSRYSGGSRKFQSSSPAFSVIFHSHQQVKPQAELLNKHTNHTSSSSHYRSSLIRGAHSSEGYHCNSSVSATALVTSSRGK